MSAFCENGVRSHALMGRLCVGISGGYVSGAIVGGVLQAFLKRFSFAVLSDLTSKKRKSLFSDSLRHSVISAQRKTDFGFRDSQIS